MQETSMPTVVALVNDLIFASKIRGAAAKAGVAVRTVDSSDALLEACRTMRPRLVLVDLDIRSTDAPSLIERLKSDGATASGRVVAFAPHVKRDVIQAARAAGADRVLARSAFVRELPALLRGSEEAGSERGPGPDAS